jgi:cytosine deaminase
VVVQAIHGHRRLSVRPFDLVVRNVRPMGGPPTDLAVRDGTWAPLETQNGAPLKELDGQGMLGLPGFVDGHLHLDKTLLGVPWQPHVPGGTVRQRIAAEKVIYASLPHDSVSDRARRLADLALSRGTTSIRTHVDIDPERRLAGLAALLAVREDYRDRLAMQIVAFPQSGVISAPGTADLLAAAIEEGADVVGGLDPIGIDADLDGQLDVIFDVAERYGKAVDIHLHDADELAAITLESIAARTMAADLSGRVNVSHAYGLGDLAPARLRQVAFTLARAGVSIMSNAPGRGSFPPIDMLLEAGVQVFSGSDNIRDPWWPFGDADQLERAMLVAYRMDWRTDAWLEESLRLVTDRAAAALGLGPYGLGISGAPADLVLVAAETLAEAVVARPPRAAVLSRGCLVSGSLELQLA